MHASEILLSPDDIRSALASVAHVEAAPGGPSGEVGEVLRAAAVDSAYARFRAGAAVQDVQIPVVVGILALVFDSDVKAERTFGQVAAAAHLRHELEGCQVAVETATSPQGLVSYWAFVYRGPAIAVLTLDTVNPQDVSMSDFRPLVLRVAERLNAVA